MHQINILLCSYCKNNSNTVFPEHFLNSRTWLQRKEKHYTMSNATRQWSNSEAQLCKNPDTYIQSNTFSTWHVMMLAYVPISLACKGNTKCQARYPSNRNKQINYSSTGNSREPGLVPPPKQNNNTENQWLHSWWGGTHTTVYCCAAEAWVPAWHDEFNICL